MHRGFNNINICLIRERLFANFIMIKIKKGIHKNGVVKI